MKSQTNEEIENKLKVILQNISTGFFSKDSAQVTSNFTLLWNYYYNSNLIKTTKRNNEMILPVLFDMITTYPIFLPKLQSRFCALFCKIIRKPKYIPDNLHFSIKKVLYLYKMLFCPKKRLFNICINPPEYFDFFSHVRYFFNEDDAKYLVKNYFYRLGNSDIISTKSLMIICRFFPPKYFKMIINDLLILFKNSISPTHSNAIISFIQECILYENNEYSQLAKKNANEALNFEWFNWTPHLEYFFNYAFLILNPKVNINGINFSANCQNDSISLQGITDPYDYSLINYISNVIILLIVNGKQGDTVLKYFEELINILAPLFFTSSSIANANQIKKENFGNSTKVVIMCENNEIEFALFIQFVISQFHENNIKFLRKNKFNDNLQRTANANRHQIKEFVRIVLPIIQTAIFRSNQYFQKLITESIRYLAELDFQQVGQLLLEQSVENIIDVEMSHFSLTCIEIVKQLIPSIITDKNALIESKDFIPKIIYSSIECLSNVDENIYTIGISIIGTICQFVEADSNKDESTNVDIQEVDNCRKAIIQCLENTFDQFIEYTISHEEHSQNTKDVVMNESFMKPFYFSSYFMSFENSFIESKVPFLIDIIDQSMDKCSIANVLYSLFNSKPILFDFLIPKILDRLDKAISDNDKKKKKYFSSILSKLCIFSPYFVPFVDDIKKRVDILIEECTLNSFKCVSSLLSFVDSFASHNNFLLHQGKPINVKGVKINDTDKVSQKKWEWLGKEVEGLKIISFELTDDFVIDQLNYFIQTLQKLEKIYFQEEENNNESSSKSINFKIQKNIISILYIFCELFEAKGRFFESDPKSYLKLTEESPGVTEIDLIIKKIELMIRSMIIKGLKKYKNTSQKYPNSQKLQLFVKFAEKYFFKCKYNFVRNVQSLDAAKNIKLSFKNKGKKVMFHKLVAPFSISTMIKYVYKMEYDDEIVQLIYEISHTKNASIFEPSINIISHFASYNKKVYVDMAIKELEVLETKKRILHSSSSSSTINCVNVDSSDLEKINSNDDDVLTEEQCITALVILAITYPTRLCYENEYLTRLLKVIVNLKFDTKWNISKYLGTLYKEISFIRDNFEVKNDKAWNDLTNSIIPTAKKQNENDQNVSDVNESGPRIWTSFHEIFFMVLDLIAFQKPPVSPKFFKFLISTCFNFYEPNRINCILALSNNFARMKPHTKKIQVNNVPNDSYFDYNCPIYLKGFLKNPDLAPLFTIYEGKPEFDQSDGFQSLREIVFDFFTKEKMDLLIDSIAFSLNDQSPENDEDDDNNTDHFVIIFECFCKGLSMILGAKIIPLIKEKLFDIALNKTGPLLSILFSIIEGIWRSSKHWSKEEVDLLKDELIIPIFRIFFFKRNSADAFQMIQSAASSFSTRRDIRRLDWLFEFIMNSIDEISKNSDTKDSLSEEKENILTHLIDFCSSLFYTSSDGRFADKYYYYFSEKVLPAFGSPNNFDFNNHTNAAISSLAKFSSCTINTSFIFTENHENDSNSDSLPKWVSIPFEKIFDVQYKNKRFDKLIVFLLDLISPASIGLNCFIPFISERFEQIFTILTNLSTKFQKCGYSLIVQVGLLHWEKYADLLFETVLKKIKNVIIPSLTVVQHGWWIKCNIVVFLHVICIRNLFVLPIEVYKMIMKEILPLLICDRNENVRESSMNLLIFLVNVVYSGKFEIISQECLAVFDKNLTPNELMNEEFATATACALLCNMSTLMNSCPKWLPLIFNQLENEYFKGTSFKNVIQKTVKGFWIRHGVREIPELEAYRFSLCESYYA